MKASRLFCFGHRGACGHEPENTVRSVTKALDLGADGIEIDVHLVDGHLMVIHDDTLNRTTNGKGSLSGKSFAELRALDAGHGERIPTLEEIFETVNRRAVINVELKGPATAEPVVQFIEKFVQERGWRYEDFLVSSFDFEQIQTTKSLQPKIRIGALIDKSPRARVELAGELGAWSINVSKRCVSPKVVADAHRHGLKVFVYTVNRPVEIAAMTALDVDGVFSDYPERVVAASRTE